MSETPDDGAHGADGTGDASEPDAPLDFDPYRFGAPEHPVPPEFAPPGYRPPPPDPTTAQPGFQQPGFPPPPQYPGYPGYPPPGGQYPAYPPPGYRPTYPPGPGYPPVPPNYSAQYPPPRTGNARATAGMVLGIVSILLCWLVLIDFIVVGLGITFSILGRTAAARQPQLGGKGAATAGLVCSVVGLVLTVVLLVVVVHAVTQCNPLYPQNSTAWNDCVQHQLHLR